MEEDNVQRIIEILYGFESEQYQVEVRMKIYPDHSNDWFYGMECGSCTTVSHSVGSSDPER